MALPKSAESRGKLNQHTRFKGDAIVRVFVDDELVWSARRTGNTRDGSVVSETPKIGLLQGARLLRLESDSAGPNYNDHVTWANPEFLP
jgi:hypothetical protein